MNLVIDVGNTRSKYAFFDGSRLMEAEYQINRVFESIRTWKGRGKPVDLFLSGSGYLNEKTKILLKTETDSWLEATPEMELPLKIGYATPQTLGFDRIAICVGAMSLFPQQPLLVIDSGTAVTFNYVDKDGCFLGGNISPGLDMRFKGLHHFTARLPYVHPTEEYGGMGHTTEDAIRNGVMEGMLFEVEAYIRHFQEKETSGKVVITGGNSHFLEKYLTMETVFCSNLGFQGLNEIFQFTKNP